MALVNQAEFARLEGVARKTVTDWKNRNWLVISGTLVDVEASRKILKKYRPTPAKTVTQLQSKNAKTSARSNKASNTKKAAPGNTTRARKAPAKTPALDPDSVEFDLAMDIATNGAPHSINEARRIKENFLAKLREQEYLQKTGELVEMAEVETALFEANRGHRDTWLAWPSKVAPLIAARLGVEVQPMVEALNEYVHKQITQLGDAELEIGDDE